MLSRTERESINDQLDENTHSKLCHFFNSRVSKRACKETALEAAIVLSYAFATAPFVDDAKWLPFMIASTAIVINYLVRMNRSTQLLVEQTRPLLSVIFSLSDFWNRRVLVHESGHALAISYLYKANPIITIDPWSAGGSTSLNNDDYTLSSLGHKFGLHHTNAVVAASGTGMEMIWNALCLMAAQCLPDNYFQAKWNLRLTVCFAMINSVYYALTAKIINQPGNDFISLETNSGITPDESFGLMVGAMLAFQLFLSCCSKIKKKCSQEPILVSSDADQPNASLLRMA